MKLDDIKFNKIGVSEYKRKQYDISFERLAFACKEIIDKKIEIKNTKNNKEIKDIFDTYEVYEKDKFGNSLKKENDVSREISYAKRIEIISNNSLGYSGNFLTSNSKFKTQLNRREIFIIFLLLKKELRKGNKITSFLNEAFSLLEKQNLDKDELTIKLGYPNYDECVNLINNYINNGKITEIKNYFLFGSASGKQKDLMRNNFYLEIMDLLLLGNKKNLIKCYSKIVSSKSELGVSFKHLKNLLVGKKITHSKILKNKNRLFENINIGERILFFDLHKKFSEYKHLIIGHITSIPLFKLEGKYIKLSNTYKEVIDKLKTIENENLEYSDLEDEDNLLNKMGLYEFYSSEVENNLEFFSKLTRRNLSNILNQQGDWSRIPPELINDIFGDDTTNPTIFEYISSLSIHKIINGNNDYDVFNSSINTLLNSDNTPRSYAPGGKADAIFEFNEKKFLIEPTMVKRNVTRFEWGVEDHIKKEDAEFAIIIAPNFSDRDYIEVKRKIPDGVYILLLQSFTLSKWLLEPEQIARQNLIRFINSQYKNKILI